MSEFLAAEVSPSHQGEWIIGLEGWVIADGSYRDFAVGEQRRFALEFYDKGLRRVAAQGIRSAAHEDGSLYDVAAQVLHHEPGFTMIDFGLRAYSDSPFRVAGKGSSVAGLIGLGVDHYPYFEQFGRRDDVQPAVYTWVVTGIWGEAGPWIDARRGWLGRGTAYRMPDPKRVRYEPIESTAARHPEDSTGYFLLRCKLDHEAPGRTP